MKNPENVEPLAEDTPLTSRARPSIALTLKIPADVLASLQRVAGSKEMSVEALAKLYIGQGLRQDVARLFADRVLETTAQVLTRHLQSDAEVSAILNEIRLEVA